MTDPRVLEFWLNEEQLLNETVSPLVSRSLLAGATNGAALLPAALRVFVDWDIFNRSALDFLQQYRMSVVRGISATTRDQAVRAIDDWVRSGEPLPVLQDRLSPLFGRSRADRIAVTEVTRIFAEGNQKLWESTGMVSGKRWMTAVDERVCPICGPMHNTFVDIDQQWDLSQRALDNPELQKAIASLKQATFRSPPAHVNCRCWLQPVVFEALDEDEMAEGRFEPTKK